MHRTLTTKRLLVTRHCLRLLASDDLSAIAGARPSMPHDGPFADACMPDNPSRHGPCGGGTR